MMGAPAPRRFTGWHMTAILVGFFTIVIAVNILMATFAVRSFGGVVVENSYVASQKFNGWLDEAARQDALGWEVKVVRQSDDHLLVTLRGPKTMPRRIMAVAQHPLGRQPDQNLILSQRGDGRYLSTRPISAGRWRLKLELIADGHAWRDEKDI